MLYTSLLRPRLVLIPALVLGLAACLPAPSDEDADNPVVITITNGTRRAEYRLKEYQLFVQLNYPELTEPPDSEMSSNMFHSFKRDLILATISRAYGIRIPPADVDRFSKEYLNQLGYAALPPETQELWRAEVRRRMAIRELLLRKILKAESLSDEQVAAYYEEHEDDFKKDALYRIRFVQTAGREKAEALLAHLERSEETFKNAAAEFSENDGHLFAVPMRLEELSDPFAQAVAELKPGRHSGVITLQQKEIEQYYVIHLESVISAVQISFEDAYHYIGEELQRRYCREALDKMLHDFGRSSRFTLRVHPENLPFTYQEDAKEKEV